MAEGMKTSISIGAKIDEAVAAIATLSREFDRFGRETQSRMKETSAATSELTSKIKDLVGGLLTLEGARRAVETTKELATEARTLGSVFGITQAEASRLAVAIGDVYAPASDVMTIATKLAGGIRDNEERMNRYGLATRDANGNIKNQKDLLLDAIGVVNTYKEGTDRNAASMVFFGKGALEMKEILSLTSEKIAEATEKADALGLTLTRQGEEEVDEYKKAMNDVGDVLRATAKVVGSALMPILTSIGKWFAETGADAVRGFSVIMKSLATVFDALWLTVQRFAEQLFFVVKIFGTLAGAVVESVKALASGDWEGAKAAWKRGGDMISEEAKALNDRLLKQQDEFGERFDKRWNPDTTLAGKGPNSGGTRRFTPENKNLLAELEAALAMEKLTHEKRAAEAGEFHKYSLEQEVEFWRNAIATAGLGSGDKLKATKKMWELEIEIGRRAYLTQLADMQAQAAAYRMDLDTRLRLAQDYAAKVAKAQGANSPEAAAARRQIVEIEREMAARAAEVVEIWGKAWDEIAQKRVDSARAVLDQEVALRNISRADYLAATRELLNVEQATRAAAIDRQIEAEKAKRAEGKDWDLKKLEELNAQKLILDSEYIERRAALERQAVLEAAKYNIQAKEGIQGAFEGLFRDILTPWKKTVKEMALDLGAALWGALTNVFAAKMAERLFGAGGVFGDAIEGVLGAIGLGKPKGGPGEKDAGAAAQTAAATALTGSATSLQVAGTNLNGAAFAIAEASGVQLTMAGEMLTTAATDLSGAASKLAASGGSGGGSSGGGVGIFGMIGTVVGSYFGPIGGMIGGMIGRAIDGQMAKSDAPSGGGSIGSGLGGGGMGSSPGDAAGGSFAIDSGGGYAFAARGYDIPSGVNPLVQAHAREMVLPPALADGVRDMARGRGRGRGGDNIYISTVDSRGLQRLLTDEGGAVSASVARAARDFRRGRRS